MKHIITSRAPPVVSVEIAYVLGACFRVTMLEQKHRDHVLHNFGNLLRLEHHFNMLMRWCPEKLLALVKDVRVAEKRIRDNEEKEADKAKRNLESEHIQMDKLISHCKAVNNPHVELLQTEIIGFEGFSGVGTNQKG